MNQIGAFRLAFVGHILGQHNGYSPIMGEILAGQFVQNGYSVIITSASEPRTAVIGYRADNRIPTTFGRYAGLECLQWIEFCCRRFGELAWKCQAIGEWDQGWSREHLNCRVCYI
jgi:hypothetical protein